MRVCYDVKDPLYLGLRRRFENEGETFVSRSDADLTLTDNLTNKKPKGSSVVGIGIEVPKVVLQSIGYNVVNGERKKDDIVYVLSKWFDNNFSDQTLISLPVFGRHNDNLGEDILSACGSRYMIEEHMSAMFDREELIEFLELSKHVGFVSMEFRNVEFVGLHLGIPFLGIYNAFQGVYIDLATWLSNPQPLLESWSLSLLVSTEHSVEGTRVPTNELLERRVWWLTESHKKDFVHIRSRELAVVSGWGLSPRAAQQRVLDICRRLEIPGKLYRTDVASQVEKRFEDVVQLLICSSHICKT